MPYKNESTESTTIDVRTYTRSHKATILNPLYGPKSIRYDEERVTEVSTDGEIKLEKEGYVGSITESMDITNAATEFDLYNPVSGEPLGTTATYADLQTLLYSLYFHLSE